jgi:hypothetical protein
MPPTIPSRDRTPLHASRIGPSAVKSLLIALAAALALAAFGTAAPASAATPCWKALINDWFDGRIDHVYPKACYYAALGHLPKDVDYYSSAKEDILAALAEQQREHKKVDYQQGSNGSGSGPNSGGTAAGGSESGSKGIITRAIEWLGPSNADAVPLPLVILAAVAFLLLAAAGGSVIQKRFQARRLPPPNG